MNLTINGAGSSAGGDFELVDINGAGTINGDLRCINMNVNGAGTLNGNAEIKEKLEINGIGKHSGDVSGGRAEINGSAFMDGTVSFESFDVNGTCKIAGELKSGNCEVNGSCVVGKGLRAQECRNNGALTVDGDLSAEVFRARGAFRIGGLLSADEIDIKFAHSARVREIGGGRVRIRRYDNIGTRILAVISQWIPGGTQRLDCDLLEADDIDIEDSEIRVVRGDRIVIGVNSKISRVEYRTSLDVHPSSQVAEAMKV